MKFLFITALIFSACSNELPNGYSSDTDAVQDDTENCNFEWMEIEKQDEQLAECNERAEGLMISLVQRQQALTQCSELVDNLTRK